MNIQIDWKELKYQIADKLFNKELDEAYSMGLRGGAEYATRKISMQLYIEQPKQDLTKTQSLGYDKANEIVQGCKQDIREKTGASVWEVH